MKRMFLIPFLVTVACGNVFAQETDFPKLFFSYSWLFDRSVCDKPVDESWVNEAVAKTPYFTKIWDDSAPSLFSTLFSKFKGRFSRKELTATLSVCPKFISFSDPLAIKVTWYLKSYMQEKPVASDAAFVQTVSHELLHTWVGENLGESKLLEKYKSESSVVKNHMHLMALEQFTYTASGRDDLLKRIQTFYPERQDDYARSWEIVQLEGYQKFLDEFQQN